MNTPQIADPTAGKCRCGAEPVEGIYGRTYCAQWPNCKPILFVIRTSLTGGVIQWGVSPQPMKVDYATAIQAVERYEKNPANHGCTFTIEVAQ